MGYYIGVLTLLNKQTNKERRKERKKTSRQLTRTTAATTTTTTTSTTTTTTTNNQHLNHVFFLQLFQAAYLLSLEASSTAVTTRSLFFHGDWSPGFPKVTTQLASQRLGPQSGQNVEGKWVVHTSIYTFCCFFL